MRFWKYSCGVFLIMLIAVVVRVIYNAQFGTISEERSRIERDIRVNLPVGEKETRLVEFLNERGWRYSHDSDLGLYSIQIVGRKSWSGEAHLIKINIDVKGETITNIQVADFYHTL